MMSVEGRLSRVRETGAGGGEQRSSLEFLGSDSFICIGDTDRQSQTDSMSVSMLTHSQ
jgi:hypothetical protein